MTKNRQDKAKAPTVAAAAKKAQPVRAPKASKRYTPPKRTATGRSR